MNDKTILRLLIVVIGLLVILVFQQIMPLLKSIGHSEQLINKIDQ